MRGEKPDLTMAEMLARIPNREWVTTSEARHIFNDCAAITIYRYNRDGLLTPHKTWGKKESKYRREEVEKLVRSRFVPVPLSEIESDTDEQDRDETEKKGRRLR